MFIIININLPLNIDGRYRILSMFSPMPQCIAELHFRRCHINKTKAKAYNTYVAPQATYCSCSGAFVSRVQT